MIESISAIALATHDMPRAVYRTLGFEILHGGEERIKAMIGDLQAQKATLHPEQKQ